MLLLSGQYSTATNCPATSCIRKTDSTWYDSSTPAVIPMQTLNVHLPTGDSKCIRHSQHTSAFSPYRQFYFTIKGHILRSSCRGSSSRYLTGGRFPSCCRWYTSIPFEYASSLRRQGRSRNSCCRYYLEGSVL